jgi:23S rRNA pseudouridine1911/1915/1917 synthase
LKEFKRQALHAASLGLKHPSTGQFMRWQVPLPKDLQTLIEAVKQDDLAHRERQE